MIEEDITKELLEEKFNFDYNTGKFYFKNFKVGQEAGSIIRDIKYISIDYKPINSSLLAYIMYYNEYPSGILFHINKNKLDNSKENLKDTGVLKLFNLKEITEFTLTKEVLDEIFEIDENTGDFYYKVPLGKRKIGDKAGYVASGYHRITINGIKFLAHRLAYIMYYGIIPNVIDHKNGNKLDNSKENLIDSDYLNNSKNMKKNSRSTTNVNGVNFNKATQKYVVRINDNYKTMCLGSYTTLGEAEKVRKDADKLYNYTERHGL